MRGTVTRLVADRGFGFIKAEDGRELFFHRSSLQELRFENIQEGDDVTFDEEPGAPRGLRAKVVRPIEATAPAA